MNFSFLENQIESPAKIKVIGVGGGGGNAINNMINYNLTGVDFISANTDLQALQQSKSPIIIQLGEELTRGRGAGAMPQVGREAAIESSDKIKAVLEGADMVFIAAGFGGGTGTGSSPVIAKICKDLGILTIVVGTKPFSFEGKKRTKNAEDVICELRDIADTVIVISNDRLRGIAGRKEPMISTFRKADDILHHSVKGITDLLMVPGLVNLDFADVRTIMSKPGVAIIGIGIAEGDNRAKEAAERAISHPLLEDVSIIGAKGLLLNITSTNDITMDETSEACERIYNEVGDDSEIIWGHSFDERLKNEIRVTVIATGIKPPSYMTSPKPKVAEGSGKLRDLRPEDYMNPSPVVRTIPYKKAVGETIQSDKVHKGQNNSDNLDIPTYLRR
ncbi:MAG: cell division protein FtsZ [Desulfobacterales bacterium]|nr:cell division protein FtsZ [Desulfobacterales bacterium]